MAEQKPWWDIGHQFQRAGNAFANHHGMAGSVNADAGAYDWLGNKKPGATPNNYVAQGAKGPPVPASGLPQQPVTSLLPTAPPAAASSTYSLSKQASLNPENFPTPTATPAPAAIASTGAGSLYEMRMEQARKREAAADALKVKIGGAANPYGVDTEGYRMGLNGARNRLVGQTNRDHAVVQGRIGGLASGLRDVKSDAMANDARVAMAGIESQMYTAERDRATGFESDRDRALMQLNNGDYSGAGSILDGLLSLTVNQSNADRGYGLAVNADRRAGEAATIQNAAAQLGMTETEIRNELLRYELSDVKWDRENPLQAFLRDAGTAAAGGVGQAAGTYGARQFGLGG